MKKFFTLIAAALLTVGANAQVTVWEVDYAKAATDNVEYGQGIKPERNTGTKYKVGTTDTYTFTVGTTAGTIILEENDVTISRGDGLLRYSDVRNLGLFNNSKNFYGVKNLQAGDIIEVAYNGGANSDGTMKPVPAMTDLENATVATETGTFTHSFTYNEGERNLEYTVYTLTATADGIVGFALQAAYVGKITVKRVPATSGTLICASTTANETVPAGGTDCKSVSFGSAETATFTVTTEDEAFRAANVRSTDMAARGVNIDGKDYDPIYFLSTSGTSSHTFTITASSNVTAVTMYARKNDNDATKTVSIRKDNAEGDVIATANGFGGELASADITGVSALYVPAGTYIVFKVDYTLDEGGETGGETGIETVKTAVKADGVMYNLAGQKVAAGYKGIAIVNGKKMIIK